jgi:tetratricopeptide (TPR) repeat protein
MALQMATRYMLGVMKRIALVFALLLAAEPAIAQQAPPRTQTQTQSAPRGAGVVRPLPPRIDVGPAADVEYRGCLERAATEPAVAFEDAMGWARTRGGGEPALHCAAVSLFNQGAYRQAAQAFSDLAGRYRDRRVLVRASLVAQAGHAWLAADDAAQAIAAFGAAIEISPEVATFWIDRAEALAASRKYWEAIDDLNRAADLDAARGDVYAFRAAAYRRVDSLDLALEDAERAVRLAPRMPEAWLERGILRALKGYKNGARRDWREALLLDPESPAADAARAQIERMELGGR